jgi:Tfp pilus assembly protein FimT
LGVRQAQRQDKQEEQSEELVSHIRFARKNAAAYATPG